MYIPANIIALQKQSSVYHSDRDGSDTDLSKLLVPRASGAAVATYEEELRHLGGIATMPYQDAAPALADLVIKLVEAMDAHGLSEEANDLLSANPTAAYAADGWLTDKMNRNNVRYTHPRFGRDGIRVVLLARHF